MWIVCLVDDSHEMPSLIFSEKHIRKRSKMLSAAVVASAFLRINNRAIIRHYIMKTRLFKYIENFTVKYWKFSDKKLWYFSYFCSNIDCGYSLEPPQFRWHVNIIVPTAGKIPRGMITTFTAGKKSRCMITMLMAGEISRCMISMLTAAWWKFTVHDIYVNHW